jgi:hypothetical protein
MTPPSQVQVQQPKQEVQVVRGDEPKVEPMDIVFVAAEVRARGGRGRQHQVVGACNFTWLAFLESQESAHSHGLHISPLGDLLDNCCLAPSGGSLV